MPYLFAGKRVFIKPSVVGWALMGTYVDHAYDNGQELHVIRLDQPSHGFTYLTLKRDDFLY